MTAEYKHTGTRTLTDALEQGRRSLALSLSGNLMWGAACPDLPGVHSHTPTPLQDECQHLNCHACTNKNTCQPTANINQKNALDAVQHSNQSKPKQTTGHLDELIFGLV